MATGKVLVTGASGYIAGFIIKALVADGWAVRGTIRNLARAGEVRATLGLRNRYDRRDHPAMGHRCESEHMADRETDEGHRHPLLHSFRRGQLQGRNCRAVETQQRQIMGSVEPDDPGAAHAPQATTGGHLHGDAALRHFTCAVDLRQHMGIGHRKIAIAHHKAAAAEAESRAAGFSITADQQDRGFAAFDQPSQG